MVELASFLLVDLVGSRDELIVMAPPTVLLTLYSVIAVPSLIYGFGLSLARMLVEDYTDDLFARGVACCKVEKLSRRSPFAASELVNKRFIGRARDELSDHILLVP